jgi:hypothetical protein
VLRLGDTPVAARDRLLARLDDKPATPSAPQPVRLAASAVAH